VRASSLWAQIVGVQNAVVEGVEFDEVDDALIISVRPVNRERSRCGVCRRRCPGYDLGAGRRRWRTVDVGLVMAFVEAATPRVRCASHGVVVSAVPWARHGAGHTRCFDDQVAWLVRNMSKTAVAQLLRTSWRTVGAIVTRVVADLDAQANGKDQHRLAGVRRIGIDEISYKRGHKYLMVVVDHDRGRLLWAGDGRTKKTLAGFFDLLGEQRCAQIELVSADGADLIADLVALRCPNAKLCLDPFHVVSWATDALDQVRRDMWRRAKASGQRALTRELGRARYALLKNPNNLTARQQATLAWIEQTNQPLHRAHLLKEQLRVVFAPGGPERIALLDTWLRWASRCRIPPFVELARRIRRYRDDIANTLTYRLANARVEAVNTRIRLLTRIAFGFKSADALIALVMLHLGGYDLTLPGRPKPTHT
jgi:transposase